MELCSSRKQIVSGAPREVSIVSYQILPTGNIPLACWIDRNTPVVRAFFQTAVPQMILGIEKEETNERQSGGVNKQIFLIFFCDKGDGQSKSRPSVRSGRKRVVSEGRQQYSDIHIYFRKTQKKLNPH